MAPGDLLGRGFQEAARAEFVDHRAECPTRGGADHGTGLGLQRPERVDGDLGWRVAGGGTGLTTSPAQTTGHMAAAPRTRMPVGAFQDRTGGKCSFGRLDQGCLWQREQPQGLHDPGKRVQLGLEARTQLHGRADARVSHAAPSAARSVRSWHDSTVARRCLNRAGNPGELVASDRERLSAVGRS